MTQLRVRDLGLVPYTEAMACQRLCEQDACTGDQGQIILAQHMPVITVGRDGGSEHLLVSEAELARQEIDLRTADRGGSATYHGPGQLIVYPVVRLNLPPHHQDLREFVHGLEEVAIRTAARFGVEATRSGRGRGVWVGKRKLASIAICVRRWVTTHGLALNVDGDLGPFGLINPCGLAGCEVVSLAAVLGKAPTMEEVKSEVIRHFAAVFGYETPS